MIGYVVYRSIWKGISKNSVNLPSKMDAKELHDRPRVEIHAYRMILIEISYGISSLTSP